MKHKTWSLAFVALFAGFLALNFVLFKGFVGEMLNNGRYFTPDLVRLGYVTGSTQYRMPEFTLPKQHIESWDYRGQRVDVLTLGDSFSNMRMHGRDPMYQDWIATTHNVTVLNVPVMPELTELETLIVLVNSGYLDRIRPKAVILECVERHVIAKMARQEDFGITRTLAAIDERYRKPEGKTTLPTVGFVNTSNFKFLAFAVLYHVSPNAFFSQVYLVDLTQPFFTVPRANRLLFFNEDLKSIGKANAATVALVNENLNRVNGMLKAKGIRFLFMPAVNKLTAYSDYIANNRFPRSVLFELLRHQHREYELVDTKELVLEELRKGEKDVFYADDTHWNWKAAKKIAEHIDL